MVGSNGAGKSTFLRVVSGIYRPETGTVRVDDEPVYENPVAKNQMIMVADELFFIPGANMRQMANFYAGLYDRFSMERFEELTKGFGLDPRKNIGTFSKGMKRQASIILTLSARCKFMFFDETFDGLDPVMRNLVKKLIRNDVEEFNATVILTSHSLRELEDICDHLALLHKGGMVLDSDVLDLKTKKFKAQIAFAEPFTQDKFAQIPVVRYRQQGSVANMIVDGEREELIPVLEAMKPLILDILPLTLEEIFTYEMEALGYNFDHLMEGKINE